MNSYEESKKKKERIRFLRQTEILIWKSYLQRQRRWRAIVFETFVALLLFIIAILIAKPAFLTPIQEQPEPPLSSKDIFASIKDNQDGEKVIGYAPNVPPYTTIMEKVRKMLNIDMLTGPTEHDLNMLLYNIAQYKKNNDNNKYSAIWIIWKPKKGYMWRFSIRSTERAKYEVKTKTGVNETNPHLRSGFLALQLAISQAIVDYDAKETVSYNTILEAMPVSPLMIEHTVSQALSRILLCFTLAFILPIVETEALVVHESVTRFKRALRMHYVDYSTMYIGWLVYAYLSASPVCLLAAITITMIFRWIHIVTAMILVFAYVSVMIMLALIMAMLHNKAWLACVWTTLFTLLQLYLAELLVHHKYNLTGKIVSFILHLAIPPLGLVNAFHQFAFQQIGGDSSVTPDGQTSLLTITLPWGGLILFYFSLLMLLQRTIGHERAIGGQVSWKSIIFKKAEDKNALRPIATLTGKEREQLQEVDELVAKAVSFHSVSKSIMGNPVLQKVTFDIYRGEFTMIFSDQIQKKMITTIEDLLTGLTYPDEGSINVLGHILKPGKIFMNMPHMMGYCHLSKLLIADLTVEEHFTLFLELCLWQESRHYIIEYGMIRQNELLEQCNLTAVRNERIRNLDLYYCAQLCWALAVLLEPRIVIVPYFTDHPLYKAVIKDKIMRYRGKLTIIKMCFSTLQLEFGDRVFILDSKILVFGGTPAYLFFKYGREYRVRITLRSDGSEGSNVEELSQRVIAAGGSIRAHLGSLIIVRIPAQPSKAVAELIDNLTRNSQKLSITSLHVSVPDSEEVYNRAIYESRRKLTEMHSKHHVDKETLQRIAGPVPWKRKKSCICSCVHLTSIGWKFWSFYFHHRFVFILTILTAIVTGLFIGISFSTMLNKRERDNVASQLIHGEVLNLESLNINTTLILRIDNTSTSMSMANAYVLSEPYSTYDQIKHITYTALHSSESLTEYLITRAIDSPQSFVVQFAYGMDLHTGPNKTIEIKVLYSPVHSDHAAAARSLAKVYTTLLRHYTGYYNASIEVTDDPITLDLTPWMTYEKTPPLYILCLLILSISHITLIPSMEHGLIRHTQTHAFNFSPARYWFSLYFWDLLLNWIMVFIMSGTMMLMVFLIAPTNHFHYQDLLVIPFMLFIYGLACIPQAYLFSLGSRVALNSMTYVIVNIILGETTILAKIFYGEFLTLAVWFMSLSPQYNMAFSIVRIKEIFLYNSECLVYEIEKLCSSNTFHKCCQKCGIIEECFSKQSYFTFDRGILRELISMLATAAIFTTLLLMIEYKVMRRLWIAVKLRYRPPEMTDYESVNQGVRKEMIDVIDKCKQIKNKNDKVTYNTFGEYLVAKNLSKSKLRSYVVHGVYLGLGKGEALALSGLQRHGRLDLCKMLAGYGTITYGTAWCMSKWHHATNPHKYASHISLSCEENTLPPWMSVKDGLTLIALLRGVPKKYVANEISTYIDALELKEFESVEISAIPPNARTKLHFAAAVVGAPPILIIDECTAYQKFSVQRSMYFIMHHLRKRGHALFVSSSNVESHMPITNRLAIIVDGSIYDIDTIDNLVTTYSNKGYTVVVHLKDEVEIIDMFSRYFKNFQINDTSEVLVNVQVFDSDLTWAIIFNRMEQLVAENDKVYSYIISAVPVNYIYNYILMNEKGVKHVKGLFIRTRNLINPTPEDLERLLPFEHKYNICKLKELPWSVMFHT